MTDRNVNGKTNIKTACKENNLYKGVIEIEFLAYQNIVSIIYSNHEVYT